MTTTAFVDTVTLTAAAWFNDVDTVAYGGLTSVAGTNTITASGPASMTAYAARQRFVFIPANDNSGAATLNITPSGGSALGAKSIFFNGAALVGSELKAGIPAMVVYDGTQFNLMNSSTAAANTVPVGAMLDFAGTSAPLGGWLLCDGTAVSRTTYAALFAAISTTWGVGDGATTFNLPDFRGRAAVGAGTGTVVEVVTSQAASGNAIPVASNTIKWITGMAVALTGVSGYTGLSNGSYFIVRGSATTVKFATTLANAIAGTVVTVTGTGSATITGTLTARTAGEIGGEETHSLTISEVPPVTFTASAVAHLTDGNGSPAGPSRLQAGMSTNTGSGAANTDSTDTAVTVTNGTAGGGAASNNMMPLGVATKIIKY